MMRTVPKLNANRKRRLQSEEGNFFYKMTLKKTLSWKFKMGKELYGLFRIFLFNTKNLPVHGIFFVL